MTIRPDNFVLFPGYIFHDILDAAGIAPGPDVVGRVRDLARSHEASDMGAADTLRRLDASERDRVGLLATVETLRGERNKHSLTIQKCHTALTEAGARQGDVVDRLKALVADARILALSNDGYRNDIAKLRADLSAIAAAVGWRMDDDCTPLEMARRVREERDALRAPKVAAVEWRGTYLHVGGSKVSWVDQPRIDRWRVGAAACGALGLATSKESAMRLAELLANHDPGGVWRIGKDIISPDTVRLVCPSVAVTWGES